MFKGSFIHCLHVAVPSCCTRKIEKPAADTPPVYTWFSCPIPSLLVYEFVYISDQSYSPYICCRVELCHGVTRDCGHGEVMGQGQGPSSGTILYNTV